MSYCGGRLYPFHLKLRSSQFQVFHRDGVLQGENRDSPLVWPSANSLRAGHTTRIYCSPQKIKFAFPVASGIYTRMFSHRGIQTQQASRLSDTLDQENQIRYSVYGCFPRKI